MNDNQIIREFLLNNGFKQAVSIIQSTNKGVYVTSEYCIVIYDDKYKIINRKNDSFILNENLTLDLLLATIINY